MSDAQTQTRLEDLKKELEAKVWPAAIEAGAEYHVDALEPLLKLKAQIEAIDWALKARPPAPARKIPVSF